MSTAALISAYFQSNPLELLKVERDSLRTKVRGTMKRKSYLALQRGQSASAAPDIFDKFMVVTLVIFHQLLAAKLKNRPKKE